MNLPDLHVRLIRLGCSWDIQESWVVTKVCKEQSCIDGWMVVIVICEFCHQKEVSPICPGRDTVLNHPLAICIQQPNALPKLYINKYFSMFEVIL